jgi:hypothetical protein
LVLLQMGAEAASWLSQAAGLTAAQLELLAPYAASMLARPLAASTHYLDRPRVRKIKLIFWLYGVFF